jgi:hypothetical protein
MTNASSFDQARLDHLAINTIRFLSVDAVSPAQSGQSALVQWGPVCPFGRTWFHWPGNRQWRGHCNRGRLSCGTPQTAAAATVG